MQRLKKKLKMLIKRSKNGWWDIRNGKVDFTYSGTCKGPDGNTYRVKSGKVIL